MFISCLDVPNIFRFSTALSGFQKCFQICPNIFRCFQTCSDFSNHSQIFPSIVRLFPTFCRFSKYFQMCFPTFPAHPRHFLNFPNSFKFPNIFRVSNILRFPTCSDCQAFSVFANIFIIYLIGPRALFWALFSIYIDPYIQGSIYI